MLSPVSPVRPSRLRRGDVIGLIAPASPPHSRERVERSVRYFEGLGYRVKLGRHLDARHGFSAGTDEQRADDFHRIWADPEVRAVFALRGGNGCCRLLRRLDYHLIARNPKIFVGYSDLTFLQLAIWRRTRLVTFSGPMPTTELWSDPDPYTEENLWGLLTSVARKRNLPAPPESPPATLRAGRAEGRLTGGCFSLVMSLMGTPFQPDFTGAILFLEDVREELHRIHRMLTHLDLAGVLDRIAGLILGQFTKSHPEPYHPSFPLPAIYEETLRDFTKPVLTNVAYGHIPRKLTFPQGVLARLDAGRGRITLLESAVV